jgi:tetratricopeptide (TPR) repeat protein
VSAVDTVVEPANNDNVVPCPATLSISNYRVTINTRQWVTTLHPDRSAGFYSSVFGVLPFAFGPVPAETYKVIPPGPLGAALYGKGLMDAVLSQLQATIRRRPQSTRAYNDLGVALARLGKYDEAVAQYASALAINPRDVQAHYNLANAFNPEFVDEDAVAAPASARRPDVKQAREHYRSALALDPDFVSARINLANLEASVGDYDAAIRCYQDALRTDPRSAQAHYNLAATLADPLVKLDQKDELVVKHLREGLRWKPDWVEALNNLAWMLATHEKKEIRNGPEAVRLATRACELTGYQNPRVLGTLDAAYAEAGRFAEAIDTARKGSELAVAAGENELADAARARSRLYQAGKPCHQGDSGAGR